MATYVIGDIQGCFSSLIELLRAIDFKENSDYLWFTGDLVNRGPQSLETLRFIKNLGTKAVTVLGNHDFALIALAYNAIPYDDTKFNLRDVLDAPDCEELINWLQARPLVYFDPFFNTLLVHAGILPTWNLNKCLSLAREVEFFLTSTEALSFHKNLWGDTPSCWNENLKGWDRLRFIVNCFTRMRFLENDGSLNLAIKDNQDINFIYLKPWFELQALIPKNTRILFGHWASLEGVCNTPNIYALDSGCVWGKSLTALRLEDNQRFNVACRIL